MEVRSSARSDSAGVGARKRGAVGARPHPAQLHPTARPRGKRGSRRSSRTRGRDWIPALRG